MKTSDFLKQKFRTLALKVRRFVTKKSDVSTFPETDAAGTYRTQPAYGATFPAFFLKKLHGTGHSYKKSFGSASIWVIDMFLHGSSICLIINTLTSKKVVDVRIFLYLCM